MAKYYVGKNSLTRLIHLINEALKTKLGVNDQANGTKKLGKLNVNSNSPTWGNQTGTGVAQFNIDESAMQLRQNNPDKGQLSCLVDGLFYQREGKNRVLDISDRRQAKVTLTVNLWDSNNQQKVTSVTGINTDETTQAIFATPANANWKEYYESGIIGYVSAANTITFVCLGDKPKKDLIVYLYIGTLT